MTTEVTFELDALDDDGATIAYVITVASYREFTDLVDIDLEPFATVLRDDREIGVVPLRVAYLAIAGDRWWSIDRVERHVEEKCAERAAEEAVASEGYEDDYGEEHSERFAERYWA